ncbi:recombinase family protein [Thermomonospora umbrina]|uniref:Site-specific DNA recombinase n=1 Tax=Thermomonospora umbrina TaxID=111806 RepID=A0A3D9STI7_9ACTN|nr:recombinase family protein [Thermomonospora umbrina]REE99108.1 site-specific DNA recombinase [Thermomonospora umbrina]
MVSKAGKRVLGVVRLSNLTDSTSSPDRQKQKVEQWAGLHDANVVGIAEDLDVSAISASPWDRPSLRKWLDRPEDYDVIVAWKLDRLARKTKDFLELLEWADKHAVQIVAVDDGIDLSTDIGRMVATILSVFAEFEGKTMKVRAKQTYEHNIRAGKWRGGFVPYGYQPMQTAEGWGLEPHPVTSEIIRDVIRRIIEGESANSVTEDLNRRKVPSSLDQQRIDQGKEPKGSLWRVGNLLKMLRSKTLLGQYEAEGSQYRDGQRKVITGDDGLPVQRAEPLIPLQTWEELQERLEKNSNKRSGNRRGGSLLRQVAFCAICQRPMYTVTGRGGTYYRCASRAVGSYDCGNRTVKAVELETILEDDILYKVGDLERMERVIIPGEDHTQALEQTKRAMEDVRKEKDQGFYDYVGGEDEYQGRMSQLLTTRKKLEALPQRPTRVEWRGTGETFREYWSRLSVEEKGRYLRDCGIRIDVLRWPGDAVPVLPDLEDPYPDGPKAKFIDGATYSLGSRYPKGKGRPSAITSVHLGDLVDLYSRATGLDRDSAEAQEWAKKVTTQPSEEEHRRIWQELMNEASAQ